MIFRIQKLGVLSQSIAIGPSYVWTKATIRAPSRAFLASGPLADAQESQGIVWATHPLAEGRVISLACDEKER